jgi:small subunit ribosomal protein S6
LRNYELTVILDPDIAEEDVPHAMEKLASLVAKSGGSINETNHWGRRKLSYPIEHRGEGNYVMMKLEFEPAKIAEFENNLKLAEEYLRHLLVRLDN